jgi:hypothetical protein
MKPERGDMAINFAVLNLQGITVSTNGHPNSSPDDARPVRNRPNTRPQPTARFSFTENFVRVPVVAAYRGHGGTTEPRSERDAGYRCPITLRFAAPSTSDMRLLRGARHDRTRRHPSIRDGCGTARHLPGHDNATLTSAEATTPTSRRASTSNTTANRQSRPQSRRGKRFRIDDHGDQSWPDPATPSGGNGGSRLASLYAVAVMGVLVSTRDVRLSNTIDTTSTQSGNSTNGKKKPPASWRTATT